MNKRRKLIIALGAGALAFPLASFAQVRAAKIPRVGILAVFPISRTDTNIESLRAGLRELG